MAVGATSGSISLSLARSEDNGGAAISRHELWMDDGALGEFQEVHSYDGYSVAFTVQSAAEAWLVPGLVYRVKFRAVNEIGASDWTAMTSVALADLPGPPAPPSKIPALSSESKFVLEWTAPATSHSPGGDVTGYRLEMDDGLGGSFSVIYDGVNAPSLTMFVVGGWRGAHPLVAGRAYRFRLAARAFNGLGAPSAIATIYACTPPRELAAPLLESVTSTSMTVAWREPLHNGACPLSGYSLLVDDGLSGLPLTPVPGFPTDAPTARRATLALQEADLGRSYSFLLAVSNREGAVSGPAASFLFAVAPSKPAAGPLILSTSSESISTRYDAPLPSDGGSPPVSYHLQYMGAYTEGLWRDLSGESQNTLLTTHTVTGLEKGETYFFRFRVKTAVGWGQFSDSTSAVAADAPARPAGPPVVVGDPSATSITLGFDLQSTDDGGSPITAFTLESCPDRPEGDLCLTDARFSAVATYSGAAQHTLTAAADGLAPGQVYKFRYRAANAVGGLGLPSDTASVAAADKPGAPLVASKTMEQSSKTSVRVEWGAVATSPAQSPGGDVLGYTLYVADPTTGHSWVAFNGTALGLRDQRSTTVAGLATGKAYSFSVAAHAFNGEGARSAPYEFRACVLPSPLAAPYRAAGTSTSIELHWSPPADTGGCAITGYAVFKDDGTGAGAFAEVNTANDPSVRG